MKNCYEFVLTYGPVPFIIHVSSMIGWSFMKKKAVDPDRIHPVLSMFLDRREELFFFSSSFFFFFFFFSFSEKPCCIMCKQMASFPLGISNN
jgi:hypothetical protein